MKSLRSLSSSCCFWPQPAFAQQRSRRPPRPTRNRRKLRHARKQTGRPPTTTTPWPICTRSRWRSTDAAIWPTKPSRNIALAIDADPTSEYLTSGLAELYAKTGRIRDAVVEAQDILKRDPNNLEAHKLLGRIYLRSLGDMQAGNGSESVLKLAIEQYEQIVKIEPDNHGRSPASRPALSSEQRSAEGRDRIQDCGQAAARLRRSGHHAGLPLQRGRRHRSRARRS